MIRPINLNSFASRGSDRAPDLLNSEIWTASGKTRAKLLLPFLLLLLFTATNAQVVTSLPPFPIITDSIVVIFDATQGDEGLAGYDGDIYAHTGVITNQSISPDDWKYIVADWDVNLPKAKLTKIGSDLWQLTLGKIRQYYGVPDTTNVLELAFVFRNADGSRTGRDANGANIFAPIFEPGLTVLLAEPAIEIPFDDPERSPVFANNDDTLHVTAIGRAAGTQVSSMILFVEETAVVQAANDTLKYEFIAANFNAGKHKFRIIAQDTAGASDSTGFVVMINPPARNIPSPPGTIDGINYIDNNKVTLSLFAPYKKFVYVIGDFNEWKVDTTYYMNRYEPGSDSVRFWLTLENLDPNTEYAFQYLVDGTIRIGDPYTEKVLDPWNDKEIDSETYPNLKPYPEGKTAEIVSTFQINQDRYQWQITDFERPEPEDLVIYELLIRDFIASHNYQTLIDTLDYLERLGVNAIELMPVNEFDGNISWGYNPAFYFAPDKYYGTKNDLKSFVDACHKRGIAVILDMVLNHSTGQSPFVRLYSSGKYGPPASENPWFNEKSPNPVFSFFEDLDHESPATQAFVDRVNAFWLQEYKFDGFRFDFTKGFTNTPGDGGAYDGARIAILKRMADRIRSVDAEAYVILEHFADNREETELANYGMMLWGNLNIAYSQSAMGWLEDSGFSADLSWGYFKNRGWQNPLLVTYMESHDEPWLMFKNLQFGRSDENYDVKNLQTALDRIKLVATFFLTLPGPKMLWQFGELGYDQDLPESGRTDPKPILWNYFQDENRIRLYRFFAALIKLRMENEVFRSSQTNVQMRVGQGQYDRRINLSHPSMNVAIIGNFHVVPLSVLPDFQHTGLWFDYFSGDTLNVLDLNIMINLEPGKFHIFTDKKLETPEPDLITDIEELFVSSPEHFELYQNYPNPINPSTIINYQIPVNSDVRLSIYTISGQLVRTLVLAKMQAGRHSVVWDGKDARNVEVASGVYVVRLEAGQFVKSIKMIKVK